MELLECLATIAKKLELTDDNILLLHAFNKGMLGKLGIRTAYALISELVERYELRDDPDAPTYGAQLAKKGVLTPDEGYLFAEGYLTHATESPQQPAGNAAIPETAAFDGKA